MISLFRSKKFYSFFADWFNFWTLWFLADFSTAADFGLNFLFELRFNIFLEVYLRSDFLPEAKKFLEARVSSSASVYLKSFVFIILGVFANRFSYYLSILLLLIIDSKDAILNYQIKLKFFLIKGILQLRREVRLLISSNACK